MAQNGSYTIVVKAVDAASATVAKINTNIANSTKGFTKVNTAFKGLGKEIARTAKLSGISQMASGVKEFSKQTEGAARTARNFASSIAAIAGVGGLASIAEMAKQFMTFNNSLTNNARAIAVRARDLEAFGKVAGLAGVDVGEATQSIMGLANTMQDALNGRNADAAAYFKLLGINIQGVGTSAKSPLQILPQLADKFAAMQDSVAKTQIARALGLEALLPMLNLGSKGLAAYNAQVARYVNRSAAGQQAADKMRVGYSLLGYSVESLAMGMAEALAPTLTSLMETVRPMIDSLTDWVRANKVLIGTKVRDWLADLVTAATALWHKIDGFVSATIGWKNALLGLAAIAALTPILVGIGMVLGPIGSIFRTVCGVVRLAATGFGLLRFLGSGLATMLRMLVPIVYEFGAALLANPVGLTIAAIAALVAIGYELYRNWDDIVAWVSDVWAKMWKWSKATFEKVKETVIDLTEKATTKFKETWTTVHEWFKKAWIAVKDFLIGIFDPIVAKFESVVESIKTIIREVLDLVPDSMLPDALRDWKRSSSAEYGSMTHGNVDAGGVAAPQDHLPPNVEKEIREEATRQGVDPDFAVAIARNEHGGDGVTSPAGAVGYMQVMPATGRGMGYDVNDHHQNIVAGVQYLRDRLRASGGDQMIAGAGYNAGPGGAANFARSGKIEDLPAETQKYIRMLRAQGIPTFAPNRPASANAPGNVLQQEQDRATGRSRPEAYLPQSFADNSQVHVTVSFENTPPGTRTQASANGGARVRTIRTAAPAYG